MRKFLLKLLFLLPIPIIVIVTNYVVDPANLFRNTMTENDGKTHEDQMVNYIAQQYNATNVGSYNERLFNKAFINSMTGSPDIAVFGSSKAQLIDDTFFDEQLVNNSVTGATLEDILGLFQIYYGKSEMPKKIILELSPGMLNGQNTSTRWKDLELEYDLLHAILLGKTDPKKDNFGWSIAPKYYELISFEYFQQSIKKVWEEDELEKKNAVLFNKDEFVDEYSIDSLYNNLTASGFSYKPKNKESKIDFLNRVLGQDDFYSQWLKLYPDEELMDEDQNLIEETKQHKGDQSVYKEKVILRNRKLFESTFWEHCPIMETTAMFKTLKRDNKGLTVCMDGTISYPKEFRNRSIKDVSYAANAATQGELFGFENFDKIDPEKVTLINKFVELAQTNDIEVIIYLGAFHPIVYDHIQKNDLWQVRRAEQTYISIAKKYGLKFIGSYDPEKLKLSNRDFLDGMHLKRAALKKVVTK